MPSRRRMLSAVGAAGVAALAGCSAGASQRVTGAWPQYGRTATNASATDARGPVEDVALQWDASLGLPLDQSPVVAGGRVFLGGLDRFVAFDAASGDEDWRVDIPEDQRFNDSAAAVGDGTVVAGFGGVLRAFDAATGDEQWTERPGDGISAPTLRDGILYYGVAETGSVEARALADGSRAWRTEVGEWLPGPVALAGDTVVVAAARDDDPGVLRGLDAASGEERWQYDLDPEATDDESVEGDPSGVSAGGGRAYVGLDDGSVHAVRLADGERAWRFDPGTTVTYEGFGGDAEPRQPAVDAPPAVGDGTVYVAHGDGRLYAVDAGTGEADWSFWGWNAMPGQPAVGEDAVYVGCADSFLYALDPIEGERRWEFSTRRAIRAAPAVVDGHVFVTSADERLYALGGGA
ncbi:PQQ-binding-like beta-propeller repeat protein [Halorarius halobius]|uniref:outer membrane protein assembly factor BamB family protein n=1 Tax=Halorarius halobius TaxID=2962671 RepID=UPI0020CF1C83|nr:PQQ-binding-like beta-propeller repeat protein [Halorarius halobius]